MDKNFQALTREEIEREILREFPEFPEIEKVSEYLLEDKSIYGRLRFYLSKYRSSPTIALEKKTFKKWDKMYAKNRKASGLKRYEGFIDRTKRKISLFSRPWGSEKEREEVKDEFNTNKETPDWNKRFKTFIRNFSILVGLLVGILTVAKLWKELNSPNPASKQQVIPKGK